MRQRLLIPSTSIMQMNELTTCALDKRGRFALERELNCSEETMNLKFKRFSISFELKPVGEANDLNFLFSSFMFPSFSHRRFLRS